MTDQEISAKLKAFVDAHNKQDPLRTADAHSMECMCNRCLFDFIKAAAERLRDRK